MNIFYFLWAHLGININIPSMPIYSNLGFDVLGHATSIAIGAKSYEAMVNELILQPLNLTSTGVNVTSGLLEVPTMLARVAVPYVESAKKNGGPPMPCGSFCLEDFGWQQPSGAMYSTVSDLSSVLSMLFRADTDTNNNVKEDGNVKEKKEKKEEKKNRGKRPKGSPFSSSPPLLDPATIREILHPRYITTDREGGYATTFELYHIGNYMIRSKRGDVDGYASEIILVPELQLGIVVLASMVEHAQYVAQRLTGMILPAFDAHFRTLGPSLPPSPFHLSTYVGTYQPFPTTTTVSTASLQPTLHVTLSSSGDVVLIDWNRSRLQFEEVLDEEEGVQHIYRLLPWSGELLLHLCIRCYYQILILVTLTYIKI